MQNRCSGGQERQLQYGGIGVSMLSTQSDQWESLAVSHLGAYAAKQLLSYRLDLLMYLVVAGAIVMGTGTFCTVADAALIAVGRSEPEDKTSKSYG